MQQQNILKLCCLLALIGIAQSTSNGAFPNACKNKKDSSKCQKMEVYPVTLIRFPTFYLEKRLSKTDLKSIKKKNLWQPFLWKKKIHDWYNFYKTILLIYSPWEVKMDIYIETICIGNSTISYININNILTSRLTFWMHNLKKNSR